MEKKCAGIEGALAMKRLGKCSVLKWAAKEHGTEGRLYTFDAFVMLITCFLGSDLPFDRACLQLVKRGRNNIVG